MTEDSKDRRIAIVVLVVVLVVVLLLGIFIGRASACDSFDDCMDQHPQQVYPEQGEMLKAIAYKLDEISRKLDDKDRPIVYDVKGNK